MEKNLIEQLYVTNLWNKYSFNWDNINSDVNILVGVNGSGKSTFIQIIRSLLEGNITYFSNIDIKNAKLKLTENIIEYDNNTFTRTGKETTPYLYISTWDLPILHQRALRMDERPLDAELDATIYQRDSSRFSFTDYRLKALTSASENKRINNRIKHFFQRINKLFEHTGKKIEINKSDNTIHFNDHGRIIPLNYLSSGEKQLLIILFKVLIMDETAHIILLDEPEISMHIEWQYKLIDEIREINPNTQLIISSHSPSIFGKGWMEKIIYIDDLIENNHEANEL